MMNGEVIDLAIHKGVELNLGAGLQFKGETIQQCGREE
jgi:hypothetical protein